MINLQREHHNKIDFGNGEYYQNFKRLHPEVNLTQLEYIKILKTFMSIVVRKITLEMYRFSIHGLGLFYLVKQKQAFQIKEDGTAKLNASINWPETKKVRQLTGDKNKKVVYLNNHTNGYIYKLKWYKNNIAFTNRQFYSFLPSQPVKRRIGKMIKENIKPLNAYAS